MCCPRWVLHRCCSVVTTGSPHPPRLALRGVTEPEPHQGPLPSPAQPCADHCQAAIRNALGLPSQLPQLRLLQRSLRWLMSHSSFPLFFHPRSAHTARAGRHHSALTLPISPSAAASYQLNLRKLCCWFFPFIRSVWGTPSPSP